MTVTSTNLDGYGAQAIEWQQVADTLATDHAQIPGTEGPNRHTAWLTIVNPDGTPHIRTLAITQNKGVWYFSSGPSTRKSRNLAANPACAVSKATQAFDLVIEGSARRVRNYAELHTVAARFNEEGWPARVEDDAVKAEFSAPSAGPPPWFIYPVEPVTVYAFGTAEPFGATKFEFRKVSR